MILFTSLLYSLANKSVSFFHTECDDFVTTDRDKIYLLTHNSGINLKRAYADIYIHLNGVNYQH